MGHYLTRASPDSMKCAAIIVTATLAVAAGLPNFSLELDESSFFRKAGVANPKSASQDVVGTSPTVGTPALDSMEVVDPAGNSLEVGVSTNGTHYFRTVSADANSASDENFSRAGTHFFRTVSADANSASDEHFSIDGQGASHPVSSAVAQVYSANSHFPFSNPSTYFAVDDDSSSNEISVSLGAAQNHFRLSPADPEYKFANANNFPSDRTVQKQYIPLDSIELDDINVNLLPLLFNTVQDQAAPIDNTAVPYSAPVESTYLAPAVENTAFEYNAPAVGNAVFDNTAFDYQTPAADSTALDYSTPAVDNANFDYSASTVGNTGFDYSSAATDVNTAFDYSAQTAQNTVNTDLSASADTNNYGEYSNRAQKSFQYLVSPSVYSVASSPVVSTSQLLVPTISSSYNVPLYSASNPISHPVYYNYAAQQISHTSLPRVVPV